MTNQPPTHFPARPMPDHNQWPAFSILGDDVRPGVTDLSGLLPKPAGATGFIRIAGGHFVTDGGKRWRIWGVNLTAQGCLPSTQNAPLLARHLAKYGINCVRLHFMDLRWPNGLLIRSRQPAAKRESGDFPVRNHTETTRSLDPEAMARLDFFIACLKENGIYTDLNLNVARPFTEADGVAQADWVGYAKALTYFDPTLIELQKEYAAQLLEHTNPFTGNRYVDEPAVALVELVNENSLLESWLSDRLHGGQSKPAGTWCDIPSNYAAELDRRWNGWLRQQYASNADLSIAWLGDLREDEKLENGSVRRLRRAEFANASKSRFGDETQFYTEIEQRYFDEMTHYLRDELGVNQVILGSSDHNQGLNNPFHLENLARLGVTDGHFYWEHPEFPGSAWNPKNWTITNTPMVDSVDRNVIARVARSRVHGLPYVVSETNCPFPNDFAAGFIPILAAYACFQDWDGIFLYTYNDNEPEDLHGGVVRGFFSIASDPVKMAELAGAGLLFLRGDVETARRTIQREITREQMVEGQRAPLGDAPYLAANLPGRLALTHGLEIARFDAEIPAPREGEIPLETAEIVSDTGQLRWVAAPGDGRVTADTPCWQMAAGRAGSFSTTHLLVKLAIPYGVVQVISLDGRPLAEAGQILLLTTARMANNQMTWTDAHRRSLADQMGTAPTRIEPFSGEITLRGMQPALEVRIVCLDGSGQPDGEHTSLTKTMDGWLINLDHLPPSVWYLLDVKR